MDIANWILVVLLVWLGIGLAVAYIFGRVAQSMEAPARHDQKAPRSSYFSRKIQSMIQPFGR